VQQIPKTHAEQVAPGMNNGVVSWKAYPKPAQVIPMLQYAP
jgi:hypothetical protein